MLCTSGFVDDFTFAHNRRPGKGDAYTRSDSPGRSTNLIYRVAEPKNVPGGTDVLGK